MSLWAAIAGGANEFLRQSQSAEEEERFLRKQEMLARLEEERAERREARKVVSESVDPMTGKMIRLRADNSRDELDAPEPLVRQAAMANRDKLLQDSDRERAIARQEMLDKQKEEDRRAAAGERGLANRSRSLAMAATIANQEERGWKLNEGSGRFERDPNFVESEKPLTSTEANKALDTARRLIDSRRRPEAPLTPEQLSAQNELRKAVATRIPSYIEAALAKFEDEMRGNKMQPPSTAITP
jgi:hypothetical protein